MQELHFPTGGKRCLLREDVPEMIILHFRLDCQDGLEETLATGRAKWLAFQPKAAVRDQPEIAPQALSLMSADAIARPATLYVPAAPSDVRPNI